MLLTIINRHKPSILGSPTPIWFTIAVSIPVPCPLPPPDGPRSVASPTRSRDSAPPVICAIMVQLTPLQLATTAPISRQVPSRWRQHWSISKATSLSHAHGYGVDTDTKYTKNLMYDGIWTGVWHPKQDIVFIFWRFSIDTVFWPLAILGVIFEPSPFRDFLINISRAPGRLTPDSNQWKWCTSCWMIVHSASLSSRIDEIAWF